MEEHPINKFRGGIPEKDPFYIHSDELNTILADNWNEFKQGVQLGRNHGILEAKIEGRDAQVTISWMENDEIQVREKMMPIMDLVMIMIGLGRTLTPTEEEEQ